MPPSKFHQLTTTVDKPRRFTFPFCYEPHELCRIAARQLISYIESVDSWRDELNGGKMLGVLVVETEEGRLGFLAAFSGLLQGTNDHAYFVPPVFDAARPDGYFKRRESQITAINHQIELLIHSDEYVSACQEAAQAEAQAQREEDQYRLLMSQAKQRRDATRQGGVELTAETALQLIRESQHMKAELKRIKRRNTELKATHSAAKHAIEQRVEALKTQRRQMSDSLQQWLFSQYNLLNAHGESRPLTEIFASTPAKTPPAGAGDCCAPKLLQYAYLHKLRPVCMAELWYGRSPHSEIRHHLHYYPACRGKCLPILTWMMQGLDVDPDPQLRGCAYPLEVVYEDDSIIVVDKPAGMLTVPGRSRRESVLSLLGESRPGMTGPVIVHRLDMDTSGLIVAAKTVKAYHNLQQQFRRHTVSKTYTALLDGPITREANGEVNLPLYSDPLDRPYQKVDFNLGKPALTTYHVIESTPTATLISLSPHTGRTHQLRVHCASPLGLATPIRGDRLYGHPAERLFLHAAVLSFTHPDTGKTVTFERKAPFGMTINMKNND